MILHCNFEELRALAYGAEMVLSGQPVASGAAVAAPAEAIALVEQLLPRLTGDISLTTLAEHHQVRGAISVICEGFQERLDDRILEFHPGHEEAVATYFDYAYSRTVLHRVDQIGAEMDAIIELITGAPPTIETAASITFPD
ncbi:MAG TPA: hypothetical protein VHG28_03395 [Longimicrobiaceae bacterium]|nr:hypothetical protein [Longimicrobiaceae bacterium]